MDEKIYNTYFWWKGYILAPSMVRELKSFLPSIQEYWEALKRNSRYILTDLQRDGLDRRKEVVEKIYRRAVKKWINLFTDPNLDMTSDEDFIIFLKMLVDCLKPYSKYVGERKDRQYIKKILTKIIEEYYEENK